MGFFGKLFSGIENFFIDEFHRLKAKFGSETLSLATGVVTAFVHNVESDLSLKGAQKAASVVANSLGVFKSLGIEIAENEIRQIMETVVAKLPKAATPDSSTPQL